MHIIQPPLFDFEAFIALKGNDRLLIVLEGLAAEKLLVALEKERWTGRKGYCVRGMWAALIAGVLHQCDSLAGVVRLLKRNKDIRMICGFPGKDEIPSEDAIGRFLKKLVRHEALLEECFRGLVEKLRQLLPEFGRKLVADSTDIEAYSNGHKKEKSDPDARWGVKGKHGNGEIEAETGLEGGERKGKRRDLYYWFGYKLHVLVDAIYELPVSFLLTPANESDTQQLEGLLEKAEVKRPEAKADFVIADKGYDSSHNCKMVYLDYKAAPIIPIIERPGAQLPDICNAKGTPTCGCGLEMVYWGRDGDYLKYRCPQVLGKAACRFLSPCTASPYGYVLKLPIHDDPRRHPPVPRESKKWQRLYRLRSAIERVNGRIKDFLGLRNITLRGIAKVTVRSLLGLLVMLAIAVGMAQRRRLKELRVLAA